jgi:hypothetical protein
LARLLTARGDAELLKGLNPEDIPQATRESVLALADTLAAAWTIEGVRLNEVAAAYEASEEPSQVVRRLVDDLRGLAVLATSAADDLNSLPPGLRKLR